MISILRGRGAIAEAADAAGALSIRIDAPHSLAPWAGLRAIVEQGRRARGDARWASAVASRRAIVSLAMPEMEASLDAGERDARRGASALPYGELPNAVLRDGAIYRAWGAAIADLFSGERVAIVIPELDAIDLESFRAMRFLLATTRGKAEITIAIGHDVARSHTDAHEAFLRARRLRELALLEALDFTRVVSRDGDGAPSPASPAAGASIDALRSAFGAFAFEPAIRLARALLDDDAKPPLAGRDLRDALHLGGLALYNVAVLSRDEWSTATLRDRFTRLLPLETEPLARSHAQYRLALIHARGRGDFDAALAAADDAIAEADRGASDPRASLFAGWARNCRAYVRMRTGDFASAAADTESGYAALAKPAAGVSGVEVEIARMLISNNRARVALMSGDLSALDRWTAIRMRHYDALPPGDRPGAAWTPPPDDDRDLAAQRDYHAANLASARDHFDPENEAIAAHGLGVALYRLGDARRAHDAFATSLRIWTITGGFPEDLLTEELNAAVTAFRSGDTTRAADGFARLRASPLMDNEAAQAETLAALAMIDARAKNVERAIERGDEAVRAADAVGEPDVLVRTLRSAAEARLITGDRAGASSLADRALAVVAEVEAVGGAISPEDVLGVLVTKLDALAERDVMRRAILLAPAATADANAWWDVPRLDAHVKADPRFAADAELAPALAEIARIVGQRAG